jgi:hypothetical protein
MSNGRYLCAREDTEYHQDARPRYTRGWRTRRTRRGRRGNALVFAHVGDLAPQRDKGQDAEVHDEDGPEHGDVKDGDEGGEKGERDGLCRAVPAGVFCVCVRTWFSHRAGAKRGVEEAGTNQNLNSGSLRMNGRNSPSSCTSPLLVGKVGAPSSASVSARSASSAGSNFGVIKARKRFRR